MKKRNHSLAIISACLCLLACSLADKALAQNKKEYGSDVALVKPFATKVDTKFSKIIGWGNVTPQAPANYKVLRFADSLNSPRNIYIAPNGDILVAQARTEKKEEDEDKKKSRNKFNDASPNNILLFRDTDNDSIADTKKVLLSGLSQPFGMLVLNNYLYIANTDAIMRYAYNGRTGEVSGTSEKILDLTADGYNNHWTRNIITNKDHSKIFVAVGSSSNIGENGMEYEVRRANILEISPDGKQERVYASGLRNPVGIAFEPSTGALWTAVNERDELGDELVPDYMTRVKDGGWYGWPYTYWGNHPDPRWKDSMPSQLPEALVPDFALGAHTASLGLAFPTIRGFKQGAYIAQHGSWNRSHFAGYKVVFIPFTNGKPSGKAEDFLTGFIANEASAEVHGRPVTIAFTQRYMLVTDDAANIIWAVVPK